MQRRFKRMIAERNAALLTLDESKLRAYARRYGVAMPEDPIIFWAGIHKARCMWLECPPDKRAESVRWLDEHGMGAGVP